jgi:glucose/arabinose dehydrogenase
VEEFSAAGQPLKSFGTTQSGYGALGNTGAIAAGPDGRIYVAQPDYAWVPVFNLDGTFSTEFGLQSDPGMGGRNLEFPLGLAISPAGHIFVADSGSNRITEFAPAPAAARTPLLVPPSSRARWLPGIGGALAILLLAGIGFVAGRRRRPAATKPLIPNVPTATASRDAGLLAAVSRRQLLTGATALTGVAVGAGLLPVNLRKALAATAASPPRGSLRDIEHIVILMQENRSFDHYFTSAFRFADAPAAYPRDAMALSLTAADAGELTAQQEVNNNPAPVIPAVNPPWPPR